MFKKEDPLIKLDPALAKDSKDYLIINTINQIIDKILNGDLQ